MRPTSTLGWCMGVDKPLIWLDSKSLFPLKNSEVRKAFKEAFIFIDFDDDKWLLKFKNILELPYSEILEIWNSKSTARNELCENIISSKYKSISKRAFKMIFEPRV